MEAIKLNLKLKHDEYRIKLIRKTDGHLKIFTLRGKSAKSCFKQLWNKVSKADWKFEDYVSPDGVIHFEEVDINE